MERNRENHRSYVVWWTKKLEDIIWEEAFKRYKYCIWHGPAPFSFGFQHAFAENGKPFVLKK
ncbi:hypothetical protein GCM10010978_14300 [Compostibacillus humi]|uniref:Uncharacterized protein n=1 Tax=Compostibacillus humi TaxID=1245525 RepID=A0A8J3EL33_9BACI|nr:DUF3291 domain-containing protein [Compostibacillus humi]GGH74948.1 hypothetical protein GCM10010978_14300 [Compostibacillus humi]